MVNLARILLKGMEPMPCGANSITEDVLSRNGIATQKDFTPFYGRNDLFVDNVTKYAKVSVSVSDVCATNMSDFEIRASKDSDEIIATRLEDVPEERLESYIRNVLFHFTNHSNKTTMYGLIKDNKQTRAYVNEEGSIITEAGNFDYDVKHSKSISDLKHNRSLLYFSLLVFKEYNKKYNINTFEIIANYVLSGYSYEPRDLFANEVHVTNAEGYNTTSYVSSSMKYKHSDKLAVEVFQKKNHELLRNFDNVMKVANFLELTVTFEMLSELFNMLKDIKIVSVSLPSNETILANYRQLLKDPTTKLGVELESNSEGLFNDIFNVERMIEQQKIINNSDFLQTQVAYNVNIVLSYFGMTDKVIVENGIYYDIESQQPYILNISRQRFLLTQSLCLVIITTKSVLEYYDKNLLQGLMGGLPFDRSRCKRI